MKALGGGIKPVARVHVPKFGPTVQKPLTPSPMSIGNKAASPGVADMLSRPKRVRSSGIKKTASRPSAGPPAKLAQAPGASAGSMPPGGGPSMAAY